MGILSREKMNLFMKNVVELNGAFFKVKPAAWKKYNIESVKFTDIFSGPEPEFEETQRKHGMSQPTKKMGKGTLDGWVKSGKEEAEAEMKKMREQQARFREEMRQRAEDAKRKRQ